MRSMTLLALLLLAGCSGLPKARQQAALYDFGLAPPSTRAAAPLRLRTAEVVPSPGLAGSELRYRLAHRNPSQVHFFTESRWVAPPSRLLDRRLQQHLIVDRSAQCSLRVVVETFDQIFDTPASSRGVVQLRATIIAGAGREAKTHALLALAEKTAESADAGGGVAALTEAADESLGRILEWSRSLPCEGSLPPSS